jgi:catechol 2,3-dioxygenase-like lactoylglutathione lyase family enzyme
MTNAHITQVGTVFVPVKDQDRALKFYTEKLGFEKIADAEYGGGLRWVEVAPAGSDDRVALVSEREGEVSIDSRTHCAFLTDDIDRVHKTLQERGVSVDNVVGRKGTSRPGLFSFDVAVFNSAPPQFSFRDPDGNRFLIVASYGD